MSRDIAALFCPNTALTVGYSNGYLGYLAPPSAWQKGGYEAGGSIGPWSKLSSEAYGEILQGVARLRRELDGAAPDAGG
jgi:hypothetical protein